MIELIVMCMISQGNKGVYPTIMKALEHPTDSSKIITYSSDKNLKELKNGLTIDKKVCRLLTATNKEN